MHRLRRYAPLGREKIGQLGQSFTSKPDHIET